MGVALSFAIALSVLPSGCKRKTEQPPPAPPGAEVEKKEPSVAEPRPAPPEERTAPSAPAPTPEPVERPAEPTVVTPAEVSPAAVSAEAPTKEDAARLAAVVKDLEEKWSKTHSVSARVITELFSARNPIGEGLTRGVAEFFYRRDGDKLLIRRDSKYTITMSRDGQEVDRKEYTELTVCDGMHTYGLTAGLDAPRAYKSNPPKSAWHDGRSVYLAMTSEDNVTLLEDAEFDGEPVFVMEGKPRGESFRMKQVIYFSKNTGAARKAEYFDWSGRITSRMVMEDVKINPEIPLERFRFEAPDGVPIKDLTRPPG